MTGPMSPTSLARSSPAERWKSPPPIWADANRPARQRKDIARPMHARHSAAAARERSAGSHRRPLRCRPARRLVGGGSGLRPGEASLVHRSALFLDELLEFPRLALEAMRRPLEDGHVAIVRTAASIRFQAQFTLIGATNPCNCGFAGDGSGRCACTSAEITKYRGRISGRLSDRIDLHVSVSAVPARQLGTRARERSRQTFARESSWLERRSARGTRSCREIFGTVAFPGAGSIGTAG